MDKNISDNLVLKSISELCELEKSFYIPAYQRGYRWTRQQVEDLLNDILEFASTKNSDGEFYCLQPIVVKSDDEHGWELIDGQQRLTTIYIILTYLEKEIEMFFGENKKYSITFETRIDSRKFLEEELETIDESNIDFFHMSYAYQYVDEWFKETGNKKKIYFLKALCSSDENRDGINITNNIRVIWYEVEKKVNSIEIFTRLNMGKIPLTNAELVKALLLSSSNLNKSEDYIRVKQLEISSSWDNIENRLQDNDFWYFLNSERNTISTRIEFIFDLMSDDYNKKFDEKYKVQKQNNDYYTFMVFNQYLNIHGKESILEIWEDIKQYFMTFQEWFEEAFLYHYIGYLTINRHSIEKIKLALENKKKSEFKSYLQSLIIKDFKDVNIRELSYPSDNTMITKILFLFNVISTLNSKSNIRFSFKDYIDGKWSLEHIHAQNSEEFTDNKQMHEWLVEYKDYDFNDDELSEKISELLEKNNIKDRFRELQKEVFEKFSDDSNIHGIENLALLSIKDNATLSNSIFPKKRDKVMALDEEGSFIPMCTKNVFLKYYSKDLTQISSWNKSDRDQYLTSIEKILEVFFKVEGDNDEE